MAYTIANYPATGAADQVLPVPFPYIDRDHVKVTVGGLPIAHTWITDGELSVDSAYEAGTNIKVYRKTELDNRLVDYTPGSVLTEQALDMDSQQAFYLIQEWYDWAGGYLDGEASWDGSGGGGVPGGIAGDIDIAAILEALQGQIRDSHLYESLLSEIEKISVDPVNIIDRLDALDSALDGRVTVLENGQLVFNGLVSDLEDLNLDLTQRIDVVESGVVTHEDDITSLRDRITTVQGSLDNIVATDYDPLVTYYVGDIVRYNGSLYKVHDDAGGTGITGVLPTDDSYWTKTDASEYSDEVLQRLAAAERTISTLLIEDGVLEASILDRATVAEFSAVEEWSAVAQQEISALKTKDGELEASIQSIAQITDGGLGDRVAIIEENLWAGIVGAGTPENPSEGTMAAEYTVKLDVNGNIAGFGLYGDENVSDFQILADRFAIINPAAPGELPTIPFIVATVDGVPMVAIDGNVIADGTVAAHHLKASQTITVGDLTNDVLDRMFSDSAKRSSDLYDDANLGKTSEWGSVTGIGKPEDGANRSYLSGGKIYGVDSGEGTDVSNLTVRYSDLLGEKPDGDSDNTRTAMNGMDPQLVAAWADDPADRINANVTFIQGGRIETGTILAHHLGVSTLSAITASLGNITAGTMNMPGGFECGDLGDDWYGSRVGWGDTGFARHINGRVLFGVGLVSGEHSLSFDSNDGLLRIDGRPINGNNISNEAGITKRQIAVTTGSATKYATQTLTVSHSLGRPAVLSAVTSGTSHLAIIEKNETTYFKIRVIMSSGDTDYGTTLSYSYV